MHAAKCRGDCDAQGPSGDRVPPRDVGFSLLDSGQDIDDPVVKSLARFRQRQLARRALEKTRTKPLFQMTYSLADNSRR